MFHTIKRSALVLKNYKFLEYNKIFLQNPILSKFSQEKYFFHDNKQLLQQNKLKEVEKESFLDENDKKKKKKHTANKKTETQEQNKEQKNEKRSEESKGSSKTKQYDSASSLVIQTFENVKNKEKENFLECLRMYQLVGGRKRELTGFIYTALKYMEEFGVHKDLEVYKQVISLFPKEKMIPTNQFQTLFIHYPREQYCGVRVLEQMEDNGVIPDSETELLLLNIYGKNGLPLQKFWNMMYWMPKFKNLNPWPVPNPLPNDILELAKLAMIKISSIDVQSEISIFDTKDLEDSIDKTWIVSAMAPLQKELLIKHDKNKAIFVEGPFKIYVATKCVDYFQLMAKPMLDRKFPNEDLDDVSQIRNPYLETKSVDLILPPCIHEQEDGTILAVCATGTSTKDSLLSWIRFLQKDNPVISEIPVVFTLKNYSKEGVPLLEEGVPQVSEAETKKDDVKKIL